MYFLIDSLIDDGHRVSRAAARKARETQRAKETYAEGESKSEDSVDNSEDEGGAIERKVTEACHCPTEGGVAANVHVCMLELGLIELGPQRLEFRLRL